MKLSERLKQSASSSNNTLLMMLSLYLLLLAFFIVLTTLSTIEQGRREAVVKSVVSTFKGEVSALKSLPRPQSGSGMQKGGASLSDQIESLFKQSLPAVKMEQSADGTVLRLEAPAAALFVAGKARLSPGRGRLMRRLVKALKSEKGVKRFYELRFLHSIPEGADAGPDRVAVLRAGLIARRLVDQGLADTNIGTGVMPGEGSGGKRRVAFEIHMARKRIAPGELGLQGGG